jgi:glycosyltransferase involved in cell wall biosynthesis
MQLFHVLQGYPGDRLLVLGPPPEPDAQLLPCRYEPLKLLTYRLACTRFREWTSGLNTLNTFIEPQISYSMRVAREFQPDLIVTVMDKLSYYKHAWALAGRLSVPLMTITMDDPQTFERAHPSLETAFVRFLCRLYANASLSLAISKEMSDYLEEKFGRKSDVFYFGPPEGIQRRPPEDSRYLKVPPNLTLGYAGSLGLGYRDGLLAVCDALASTWTTLNIYTRDQHCLVNHPQIVNRGFVTSDRLWPKVQSECDAVLLPYAFEGQMTRVYRTHFPTKLSEYCWLGMPIIVTGPGDATGVRWALRHSDAAWAATSKDTEALARVFQKIRDNGEQRMSMAGASQRIAEIEFDPVRIKQQFVALLRTASLQSGVETISSKAK